MAESVFLQPAQGVESALCAVYWQNQGVVQSVIRPNGIISDYVPYLWCQKYCPGWTPFSISQMTLVVFQFLIPIIIFCMVLTRCWHFDLPDPFFSAGGGGIFSFSKMILSLIGVSITASIDMIFWITTVMAIAGPTTFNAIYEAWLDFTVVKQLSLNPPAGSSPRLTRQERAGILVALLCGNFDLENDRARPHIEASLIPTIWNDDKILEMKSRLASIMNSQTTFGPYVGVPAIFFLGGFAYNALGINLESAIGANWVPFAIFWILLLFMAVVSATLLTGNNPSCMSVLIVTGSVPIAPVRPWWVFLKNYFEGGFQPVSIWARGSSKRSWIDASTAATNHAQFKAHLEFSTVTWIAVTTISLILLLFPTVLAYCWAFYITYNRMGCRTLTYATYIAAQVYLILLSLYCAATSTPYLQLVALQPWKQSLVSRKRSTWHRTLDSLTWIGFIIVLPVLAVLASAIVVLPGSIFQIIGTYNSCLCQTDVSTWLKPAARKITLVRNILDSDNLARLEGLTERITWAATLVAGSVVYLGWWYQRVLRTKVARLIDGLSED